MISNTPILIFGAFDPPTNAHIAMGNYLHFRYPNCLIVYIPAKNEYLKSDWKKQVKILDLNTRVELLQNCTEDFVSVSDIEKNLSGNTYDTVETYKKLTCIPRFNIALGADNLKDINKWYKWDCLVEQNDFVIFTRGNKCQFPKYLEKYRKNFNFLKFHWGSVSSTKVREACQKEDWKTVEKLVPINVYEYLRRRNVWA